MSKTSDDINDIITSAVQARVEASVLEAMSSDGTMRAIVTAALNEEVTSPGSYGRDSKPLITYLVESSIKEQATRVVAEEIKAQEPAIREEVRVALAKSIGVITDTLVDGFVASAQGRYPSIEVSFRGRDD